MSEKQKKYYAVAGLIFLSVGVFIVVEYLGWQATVGILFIIAGVKLEIIKDLKKYMGYHNVQ